ncbi:M48 family metalloprotease [Sphingorhabdus sp.]|jgi:predicted Zn-dependent protease|uniref:M48 family metalloprotease n=2 Tax=Sphingorhabdus sp. TaxID=1902408 RepID=UPI003BB17E46|nr:M48 family metalloprotease [Sphingomonadales bacterium]MBK9433220.1 M48 family metalloprotease [Sphingomonadales bacterium]MBL0022248.1 M48 family metalloprotease [Sphingomonadales bacterium]
MASFQIRFLLRNGIAALCAVSLCAPPALAQSVLRDAETEAFFDEISRPIVAASGLDPANVDIVLINDKSVNAFVAGGQTVYIHSGLINTASTANEVQGVIAHELGHIEGGHVIRYGDGMKAASGISIASLVLAAAAIAAGAAEAGMAIMQAGQRAAIGKFLAFSRVQESVADASGARYLSKAGITGRGSVNFFKKLQNHEFRLGIPQEDSYDRTHPLSGERITVLEDTYKADPAWEAPINPKWESDFQRIKAKLQGYIADPNATLRDYPETNTSVAGHYARAYAWHKAAYPDKALNEANILVSRNPDDPYFLELQGQILLESGRPKDALASLRRAVDLTSNQPLIAAIFGHALIATEDKNNLTEAERVLRSAVAKDNNNPFAWYQLGVVYEANGDTPRAALASAERYLMEGAPQLALPNAATAMAGLPEYSHDWIRAQDIKLVAEAEVAKLEKKRR